MQTSEKKEMIGLVGAGAMGLSIATKLIENGYSVMISDKSEAAKNRCLALGARVAESNLEIIRNVDKLILCLPAVWISHAVIDEIEPELRAGKYVIETGTISPEDAIAMAKQVNGTGAKYLECTMLGIPDTCGSWTLPTSGSQETIEELSPVLHCFAEQVVYAGDYGASNTIKLLNNTLGSILIAAIHEIMVMVDGAGVDKATFFNIISNSASTANTVPFRLFAGKVVREEVDEVGHLDILKKDINLGAEMAKRNHQFPMLTTQAQIIINNAAARDSEHRNIREIYDYLKDVYGVKKV